MPRIYVFCTVIKLISGGNVCIIKAGQLFRNAMQTKTYFEKIACLEEENRQAWNWSNKELSIQLQKRITELENGIKNLRRGNYKNQDGLRISFKKEDLFNLLDGEIR